MRVLYINNSITVCSVKANIFVCDSSTIMNMTQLKQCYTDSLHSTVTEYTQYIL